MIVVKTDYKTDDIPTEKSFSNEKAACKFARGEIIRDEVRLVNVFTRSNRIRYWKSGDIEFLSPA